MYLGGNDARYQGYRPYGPQVVLDGVDIDLEQTHPACVSNPQSTTCEGVMKGWYNFVVTLRALMDADDRKLYWITAVPINTKFADPAVSFSNYGSYTHGYLPTQSHCDVRWKSGPITSTLAHPRRPKQSLFRVAHLIDFIWPQFYPSPAEITLAAVGAKSECWLRDLLAGRTSPSTLQSVQMNQTERASESASLLVQRLPTAGR